MSNSKTAWTWAWRLLAAALVVVAASLFWVDFQLDRFAGRYSEVVDHAGFKPAPTVAAITNVHVLSPDGRRMIGGQTVLIEGRRIVAVNGEPPASGIPAFDGGGRYLIPGLVDSHVHLRQSPNDLLLYLANGVTHVREMSGNADQLDWRQQIRNGRPGPGIFVASEKLGSWGWLDGQFQRWTRNRINVNTVAEADELVRSTAEAGYDAVKLGTFLDARLYRPIVASAASTGIPVLGHLPLGLPLEELLTSGQSELGHIEEIAKALNAEFGYFNSRNADEFLSFVAERSDELAIRLAENGIAVTSSLSLVERIPRQTLALTSLLEQLPLRYVNPGQLEGTPISRGWLPGNNPYEMDADADAETREAAKDYWNTFAQAHHIILGALQDKGVQLMAGTDAGNAGMVAGFSIHDELAALTAAGLTPSQSLLAATATPNDWMQRRAGRIAPGYTADLVLLAGNPLDDIANTRRIDAVVAGGRLLDRVRLDAMLAAVAQANDRSRSIAIDFLDP